MLAASGDERRVAAAGGWKRGEGEGVGGEGRGLEEAGVRGRPRVRAGGMNRKREVGEVEESGEGWVLDEGTETGA